jgi:hypothetical protein
LLPFRLALAATAAALLSGCYMPDQPSLTATTNDDHACRSYGAQPESQLYVDCRMRRAERREALYDEKRIAAETREDEARAKRAKWDAEAKASAPAN